MKLIQGIINPISSWSTILREELRCLQIVYLHDSTSSISEVVRLVVRAVFKVNKLTRFEMAVLKIDRFYRFTHV